jgi:DNA (cytosine-5)-methyltransferase 1
MNTVPGLSAENRSRVDYLFDNELHDLPNAERPDCHKDGTTYSSSYGRMHWELPAPTITGGFLSPGRGRFVHPKLRRVLTPREAARVQGFPDWFDFIVDESRPPSRSQLARWIGNAVPAILGRAAVSAALRGESASIAMRTELVAS